MKRYLAFFFILLTCYSCKELEARKPITRNSGSYIKESIERNKDLISSEEKIIESYIKNDSINTYIASNDGFWYAYKVKDTLGKDYTPQIGDLTNFTYNLKTLNGQTLRSKDEVGQVITQIDQSNQELISGIRDGLKIMKEGETVLFLFPSHKGYGYYGFEDIIPSNTTLKCELTLLKIKQQ